MQAVIGRGSFTTAYRVSKTEVRLDTIDPVKYHMASGYTSDSPLFPKVYAKPDGMLYMKYYPHTSNLKRNLTERHWNYYKEIKAIYNSMVWPDTCADLHRKLSNIKYQIPRDALREQLISLQAHRPHDPRFECSPRNVRAYKGKLILLDCFFYRTTLLGL